MLSLQCWQLYISNMSLNSKADQTEVEVTILLSKGGQSLKENRQHQLRPANNSVGFNIFMDHLQCRKGN